MIIGVYVKIYACWQQMAYIIITQKDTANEVKVLVAHSRKRTHFQLSSVSDPS